MARLAAGLSLAIVLVGGLVLVIAGTDITGVLGVLAMVLGTGFAIVAVGRTVTYLIGRYATPGEVPRRP